MTRYEGLQSTITLYRGTFDKFNIYIYIYMRISLYYERKVRNGEVPTDKTKVIEAVNIESNVHKRFLDKRIRIFYLYTCYAYINKKFLRLHEYHSYSRMRMNTRTTKT